MPAEPPLSPEIERLIAERVAAERRQGRVHLTIWLATIGAFVLAAVATAGFALTMEIRSLRARLDRQSADLEAAREEYQRRLAADAAMQAERAAAAKAIGYRPGPGGVAHDAGLLREFVAFMGSSSDLRKRIATVDGSDPKDLERLAGDLEEVLNKGLGTLGQIVLRNTEPAKDQQPAKAKPAPPAAPAPAAKP